MAYERPGVYQTETDQSYRTPPAEKTGLAILGRTKEGQAFVPTKISSVQEFLDIFGPPTGYDYTYYSVRNYLQYGDSVLVTRLMSESGYLHPNLGFLEIELDQEPTDELISGNTKFIIALLHHSEKAVKELGENSGLSLSLTDLGNYEYQLDITISNGVDSASETYIFSINPTNKNYITKVFPQNPQTNQYVYLYTVFDESIRKIYDFVINSGATVAINIYTFDYDFENRKYSRAETPYIISQTLNNTNYRLFKIKTLSQGNSLNRKFKVVISNVRYADEVENNGYGLFDIIVRAIDDTDSKPVILEQFSDIDLNPESPNFITRKIGDKHYEYINDSLRLVGEYDNVSRYIYIDVEDNVRNKSLSPELVPMGFEIPYVPYTNSSLDGSFPKAKYIYSPVSNFFGNTMYDEKVVLGWDYTYDDNINYLIPIPNLDSSNPLNNLNTKFLLENCITPSDAYEQPNTPISEVDNTYLRKFAIPFQNGFDGEDPALWKAFGEYISANNSMGWDFSTVNSNGTQLVKKAANILSNTNLYDFKLFMTPGLIFRLHSVSFALIFSYLIDKRNDFLYIIDIITKNDDINTAINTAKTIDNNYVTTYYPFVQIFDDINNRYVWVPPSVAVIQGYAFNDKIAKTWDAPAGLNRGILDNVFTLSYPLSPDDEKVLYKNRINPISIQQEGFVIWGQKTLQIKSSALDRVNVRRLMITLKKYVSEKLRYFIFEKNTSKNRKLIVDIIDPYLSTVREQGGIYNYEIDFSDDINTGDVIDRYELQGQIKIWPTKTAEFIIINWNIMGTTFNFEIV